MPRQEAHPRTPFALGGARTDGPVRPSVAWQPGPVVHLLLSPFAAVVAAVAGLVFVVLLPICGIATIASAAAQASWGLVRAVVSRVRRRAAPRGRSGAGR